VRRRGGLAALAPLAIALAAAVVALGGCAAPELPGTDVLGRIGGADVRYAEFGSYLRANLGESGGSLESAALSGMLDQFLTERLLARLALDRGLVRPGAAAAGAVEALLAAEPEAPITDSAIAAYYAEHSEEFRVPEQVELLGIRCEDRAAADRALRELSGDASFADVARRLSNGPTAAAGGELGTMSPGDLPPEVADAVVRLRVGQPSSPVATGDGVQIFEIARRLPEHVRPLAEVRDQIQRRLGGARADRAYARLVTEARSRYAVQVFDRNLPFVYHGKFPVARPYEVS